MASAVSPSKLTPAIFERSLWQPEQYCLTVARCASAPAAGVTGGACCAVNTPGAAATSKAAKANDKAKRMEVVIMSLRVRGQIAPQTLERTTHELVAVPHLRIELLGRRRRHRFGRRQPLVQHRRQPIVDRLVHLGL